MVEQLDFVLKWKRNSREGVGLYSDLLRWTGRAERKPGLVLMRHCLRFATFLKGNPRPAGQRVSKENDPNVQLQNDELAVGYALVADVSGRGLVWSKPRKLELDSSIWMR